MAGGGLPGTDTVSVPLLCMAASPDQQAHTSASPWM